MKIKYIIMIIGVILLLTTTIITTTPIQNNAQKPEMTQPIETAEIISHKNGTAPLDALPGQNNIMIYKNITISILSEYSEAYYIYLNGKMINNGTTVNTTTNINMQLPKGTQTIVITLGSITLNFSDLNVISRTVQEHYTKPTAPKVSTILELIISLFKGIGAAILTAIIIGLTSIKYLKYKKDHTPEVW